MGTVHTDAMDDGIERGGFVEELILKSNELDAVG